MSVIFKIGMLGSCNSCWLEVYIKHQIIQNSNKIDAISLVKQAIITFLGKNAELKYHLIEKNIEDFLFWGTMDLH